MYKIVNNAIINPEVVDPFWDNVVVYMKFDNNFTELAKGKTVTNVTGSGTAPNRTPVTSATQSKFGGYSGFYDKGGNFQAGCYSYFPTNDQDFNMGTGDFTVECWMYLTTDFSGNVCVFSFNSEASAYGQMALVGYAAGTPATYKIAWFDAQTGANTGTRLLNRDTWNHIAITRRSSTIYYCTNGHVETGYTSTVNNNVVSTRPTIRNGYYNERHYGNYMDDLRVTKGVARYYGTSYNVPTKSFPTRTLP